MARNSSAAGTASQPGLARAADMGSVATKVLHLTDLPVTLVK
ncbi:MAG TPA: hypothetical protein VLS93_12620 [Anaeromyxobacteraceae bacterium]|nr:hypothetical protein [Anaeromyxobacteraceae bacterium]